MRLIIFGNAFPFNTLGKHNLGFYKYFYDHTKWVNFRFKLIT